MPSISPMALHQLQKLYQKSGSSVETEEEQELQQNESVEIDSNESGPVVIAITTTESLSHHLPSAALAILRGNNLQHQPKQPHRNKAKIDSITRDLSNVDLD